MNERLFFCYRFKEFIFSKSFCGCGFQFFYLKGFWGFFFRNTLNKWKKITIYCTRIFLILNINKSIFKRNKEKKKQQCLSYRLSFPQHRAIQFPIVKRVETRVVEKISLSLRDKHWTHHNQGKTEKYYY